MSQPEFLPPAQLLPRIGSKGIPTYLEEGEIIRRCLASCAPPPIAGAVGLSSSLPEPLGFRRCVRRLPGRGPAPGATEGAPWPPPGARILDFGCGVGRLLYHLRADDAGYDLWGCDIDVPSMTWLQTQFQDRKRFFVNATEPPLKLPSDAFDVIFSLSVFTHIPVGWEAWLEELCRVLRPGGVAMISFQGPVLFGEHVGDTAILEEAGFHVDAPDNPWDVGGPQVYQTDAWIATNWTRFLSVRAIFRVGVGGKQSLAVLQKPPPDSSDPAVIRLPFLHEVPDSDWTAHIDFDPYGRTSWWDGCGWCEREELSGWFLSRRAPLASIAVTTSGGQPVPVRRVDRQDVAENYSDVAWARHGGFVLSRKDLQPGIDTLILTASDESGAIHTVEFQTCN